MFPYYLKTAMRKGLFKRYIRHRYNDGNVKGSIDIARHIEKNTPFNGSVAYSQRKFSYDKSLMAMSQDDISITKHGLKIPEDVPDNAGFVTRMKAHEQEFIKCVHSLMGMQLKRRILCLEQ